MSTPSISTDFSAEFQFVASCANSAVADPDSTQEGKMLLENLDWHQVSKIAHRHRVVPLVWYCLKRLSINTVPDAVKSMLQKNAVECVFSTQRLLVEISHLCKLLRQSNVDVILLKGFTTTHHAKLPPELRQSRDIDLWVTPENVVQTCRLLVQQGYRLTAPHPGNTPLQRRAVRYITNQAEYMHPEKGIFVEVHWRLFPNPYRTPIDLATALNSCCDIVDINGVEVPIFDHIHHIIYCCLHGTKHGWSRLKWLLDLPLLLNTFDEKDLDKLLLESRKLGVETCVTKTLILCHFWFGTMLPTSSITSGGIEKLRFSYHIYKKVLLSDMPHTKLVLSNAATINSCFQDDRPIPGLLHYCFGRLLSIEDFKVISLPDSLFFIYFFIRPFSFIKRHVSRFIQQRFSKKIYVSQAPG